ncbi:sigma-70 family RNA polymerase sigma factor [Streptomyces sp. SID8014]|uniref:RNA polymerase sigma factor n=1 Tax=Streptomyces sp. SID8014 TaxID=2706097 RepID=UPI0013BD0136|nr:sigma-70 family RNA polymerase sigma factor [Streptomyces sp. SID8014]NEC15078.1 sigma-70 family RNA polymerase sigma factor [Streptomyces sp. SID8014]
MDRTPISASSADRLDRLFRLYSRPVLALAARRAKRPADAEDIAAETWLLAARYLHGLQAEDERAMSWLASVARTAVRDFYKPRRQSELAEDWTDAMAARSLPASPAADAAADIEAFDLLTPHQAAVIKLKAQGLSDRRIAQRLGRSETAVWKRKRAAQRRLRDSLPLAG